MNHLVTRMLLCTVFLLGFLPVKALAAHDGTGWFLGAGPMTGYSRLRGDENVKLTPRAGTTMLAMRQGFFFVDGLDLHFMYHVRVVDIETPIDLYRLTTSMSDFGIGYGFGRSWVFTPGISYGAPIDDMCRAGYLDDSSFHEQCVLPTMKPNLAFTAKVRKDFFNSDIGLFWGAYLRVPMQMVGKGLSSPDRSADTAFVDASMYTGVRF